MAAKKVGPADIIMAVGGALLVVGALLPWYGPKGEHEIFASEQTVNGLMRFSYFGWLTALIGLVILELVQLRALAPERFKLPVPDAVVGMVLGGVAILVGLVEMIWQPMFDGAPNEYVDLQWGLFVTVLAGLVVVGGSFLKLADHGPAAIAASAAPMYAGQSYAQPAAAPYAAPQAPYAPYAPPATGVATAAPQAAPAAPEAPPIPAAVAPEMQPAAGDFGFCTSCGAAYTAADAQFCTSCGAQRAQ